MTTRKNSRQKVTAERLFNLGNVHYQKSRFREALASLQQALTIYKKIRDRHGEANSLGNLGVAYHSLGQFQLAIDYHLQYLAIAREIRDRQGEANSLGNLGSAYQSLGQFQLAIDYHLQYLAIAREIRDRQGEANSLGNLGIAYHSLGQFQLAIDYHLQLLEIAREIGDHQGEASSLGNLGNAYYSLGQYQLAIDYHLQSLAIEREIGYRQGEAASLGSLGNAYTSLGQYQLAIDYHLQSLAIEREIGYRQGEAASLGSLGNAYTSLGQFQLAIDYHQQHLEIAREIGYRQGEANSLGNLGNAYQSLGQYQLAVEYHLQSLAIEKEIGNRHGEASSLGNLGNAYTSLGQFQLAIDYHQQHLEIAREIRDRQGEANSLGNLGNAYQSLGQYQLAVEYLQQSLTIAREIRDRQGESISLNNLGETLKKINQFPEAEENLRQAITIREEIRSSLVDDSHRVSIFETQIAAYQNLQEVLVAQEKITEALEISERGRTQAFVQLLRERLSSSATTGKAEPKNGYLTLRDIQQVAQNQNATLVEYSIVYKGIYIWVISPTGDIKFRRANLQPLESLNKSLKNLGEIILKARVSTGIEEKDSKGKKIKLDTLEKEYKQDSQGNFPLLQLLHEILIAPIADILPKDPENSVIFIPHYALFLVPFAALQTPQGRYLIEDHTPLTAPSIQVLETTHEQYQRVRDKPKKALVVAEPTLHETFQKDYKLKPYEFMKEAGESIARILETRAITGNDATKVAVINAMLETRIIHIFAHAIDEYQNEKEAKVGIPGNIILAPDGENEGALNAGEILDLELNSEIVVLSACSTGKGKITGDGIMGLSRCFILAGVPSLIVSLWNIGAPAAKVLMTQFYQNLTLGKNRAAALRHAMIETKKRFQTPKSWAAFTLIGETQPLTLTTKNIQEALRAMAIPDNATPKEIVEAFSRLFDIYPPEFLREIYGLNLQPTDTIEEYAAKIKTWCKTHQNVEENIENELCEMGLSDADDDKPELDENVVKTNYQKYLDNINRHGLPADSSTKTEKKDDKPN
jgi:CHAT domain-containing protein